MKKKVQYNFNVPVELHFDDEDFVFMCNTYQYYCDTPWYNRDDDETKWRHAVWDYLVEGDYDCKAENIPDSVFDALVEETKDFYKKFFKNA